ncbi:MAG: 16S rRNA (cytosine(967)-C(5))-methyltransferase RsmB [bacterium]|nr:16S rRNA (cytosine(967)-C(5))-methyltransferase RsmB [bacterium]
MTATARGIAWHVLERVELDRAYAELVLHAALRETDLSRRDRAFATELSYGSLRMRGRIDWALEQGLDRPLAKVEPEIRNLLRISAYQILFLETIPHAAAVNEAVKLVQDADLGRAAGFTNAVLRGLAQRFDEGKVRYPDFAEDPLAYLQAWGSLPEWLAERWLEQFGAEEAAQLAEACAHAPPRTVRVAAGVDREHVARALRGRESVLAPAAVTDLQIDPVRKPAFDEGEYTIQDEASQLVPLMLGAQPGDTVVDCCAAPGGKSIQLAEQVGPGGEVIAMELHQQRLALIHRAAARMKVSNLRVLQRDAAHGFDLQGRLRFPRILVDAPCSGLGTLRRNPDARWHLRPKDIPKAAANAYSILDSAARYVSPGGVLVYSVCTFTAEETVGVLARFLQAHKKFRVDDPRPFLTPEAGKLVDDTGALVTLPHRDRCDGFYAVRLVHA